MNRHTRRTTVIAVVVALLAALAAGGGVWLAQRDGAAPPAASGVTTAPTPTPTPSPAPTTPAPQGQTMTVRVFFHQQLPGPETNPGKVVPVSRTVPRSPKVATAALTQLLGGPTAPERSAGFWSFFSADTAGMVRSVRVTGGTALADFRDFRRLLPNATSSYGSTALLAELDTTLKQFPTVRRTLYAFNGNVPAFYAWLQLGVPFTPTGSWRAIPNAPAGVQGTSTAAVWTRSRMPVWLGNAPDGPAVGATYDPARRSWRRTPPSPLGPRESFTVVWTGEEMIVFGGSSGDGLPTPAGAAYRPASDRWRVLPPAPIATGVDHAAVWTGREMLVWDASTARGTGGALYDPVRDRWSPIARGPALAANHSGPVWTGTQLIAWTGATPNPGIAYAPATNRWSTLPPAPLARGDRSGAAMVWTGREVLVWSGWSTAAASPPYRDGAAYRPTLLE